MHTAKMSCDPWNVDEFLFTDVQIAVLSKTSTDVLWAVRLAYYTSYHQSWNYRICSKILGKGMNGT